MKTRIYAAPAVKGVTLILLIMTIAVCNRLYYQITDMGMKCVFKHEDLWMFGLKLNKYA